MFSQRGVRNRYMNQYQQYQRSICSCIPADCVHVRMSQSEGVVEY